MAVAPGSRLGPFEILSPLGAGGMGEVWRARDTRLQREVAIKVLPALLAGDPERLARFEREARLLGSMNHPRIGGLLGLEDADGVPALVLELIEGPTLAQHLAKQGALPPAEAIEVAHQIAEAMEYAHERGIIHRDLKPANVKFTADGQIKVLDFGLAKALLGEEGTASDPQVSQSPTLTLGTQAGVILGTAAYMAPEQARGRTVDRRADIWAFGVIMFEMLTGRPLFGGETVSDTIARILEREPDWNQLPPHTPERVRELLRRCLEKDARKRLRDIGDAKLDLEAARRDMASGILPAAAGGTRPRVSPWMWAGVAALVFGAFVGGMWLRGAQRGSQHEVLRLSVLPPADLLVRSLWVSPDGRTLLARGESRRNEPGYPPVRQLYRRSLDRFEWEPLPGTVGVQSYDVTDDGQWIFFVGPVAPGAMQLQMSRVALDGSSPPSLVLPWPETWRSWDALPHGGFAVSIGSDSLGVLEPGTNAPAKWNKIDWESKVQELTLHETLPDGRACLATIGYFAAGGWTISAVAVDVHTGKMHLLARNAASPRYLAPGRVLFTRGSTVLAATFDPKQLRLTSEPVAVFDGVRLSNQWDHGAVNLGRDGTLAYVPGFMGARQRWVAIMRPGAEPEDWSPERGDFEMPPSIAPDGRTVAIMSVPPGSGSYETLLLTRGQPGARRFLSEPNEDCGFPAFSPDGRSLAFVRQGVTATAGVYVVEVAGGAAPRLVLPAKDGTNAFDLVRGWSADSKSILLQTLESRKFRLRRITLGDDTPTVSEVCSPPGGAWEGALSPDGSTLAFLERTSGSSQVSVATIGADGRAGPAVQVSRGGAEGLCWVPGTRTLTFTTAERVLMQSRIGADLSFSPPEIRARLADAINDSSDYTFAPDGSLVVTHKAPQEGDVTQFDLIRGFDREVERALARKPAR